MPGRATHVYCGNFVGAPYWHGLDVFEPDVCDFEGVVPLPESPEEDEMATWTCPVCHALNSVGDHS